jgi:hypothetical protein
MDVTGLGVPTGSRPWSLAVCVESHLANCRRYGRTPDVLVADVERERARAALRGLCRDGAAISHAGERRPLGAGANRNSLMQGSLDALVLSVDDDSQIAAARDANADRHVHRQ